MSFVTYIRNKALATVVRLVITGGQGTIQVHPDEVIQIPSRDDGRTIKANMYRSKARKPSPVLINFHGSGFVVPLHGSDDEFARRVCNDTDYTVIDAAYRLAPENPYPAALDDVEDVLNWVLARPIDFDLSKVVISGFSAGGNLALVVSSIRFPKNTFKHVITFYAVTDLATEPKLKQAPDSAGMAFPDWLATIFNNCYTPNSTVRKEPTVSPTYIPSADFPDSLVFITCAYDNICSEAEALAENIRAVPGKRVILRRMEKCNHAWDKSARPGTPEEKAKIEAYDLVVGLLRSDAESGPSQ